MRNIESIIRIDEGIVIEIKGKKIRVVQEDSEITLFLEDKSIIKLVFQQSDIESIKTRDTTVTNTTSTLVKPESKRRSRHRETISDLIIEEVLNVGTILTMTYLGNRYSAKVTEDGWLEIDGNIEKSPSGAAEYLTGMKCNGWKEWRLFNGLPLSYLRWKMRAKRFPDRDQGNAELSQLDKQKRMIAMGWVDYALNKGLNPGVYNEEVIDSYLADRQTRRDFDYKARTVATYRRHLSQWFEYWGS